MNRSILIIICDFLLLSLLTFSTDLTKVAGGDDTQPVKTEIAPKQTENSGKDLAAVMKLALTDEQKNRNQLQEQLAKAREITGQQQALLNERDQQSRQLQQQYLTAQANLKNLNQQLQSASADATTSKEKLALTEAEAQRQAAEAAALKQQLDQLAKNNAAIEAEKQQLASQLHFAGEKVSLMQQQVQSERDQNIRLAESFKALATNSSALTQEIRDNRALAPNTIFSTFITNQIEASINGTRPGIFGTANDTSATKTVLVTDGTNIFALCHVQDTPLVFRDPGTDWDTLTGTLGRDSTQVPIHSLSFDQQDPRVVFMPVTAAEARQLDTKVYQLSSDPYKFQDAVIIGAQADYYGECNFQMDPAMPQYLKLDRSLLKGLFGKFNPSRGDFVFSRSGNLLGVMVNGTYCLVLRNFPATATFPFGQNLHTLHTGNTLSEFYFQIFQSPMKLQ
jgi:hypothetical protein